MNTKSGAGTWTIYLTTIGGFLFAACLAATTLPRLPLQDRMSGLRLSDCALPCWVGIVPGVTTIGEARQLIQERYASRDFDVEVIEPNRTYTYAYGLNIAARRDSYSLSVWLNDNATQLQDDTSIVRDISLYPHTQDSTEQPVPKLVDMLVVLGRPACVAVQWGNHTAWPIMLYPERHARISFGTNAFAVAPNLPADLLISAEPLSCPYNAPFWRGFRWDYRPQLLRSIQP